MDYRIDLHNHSSFSDGVLSIKELYDFKKNHLDILCITDHYPDFKDAYQNGIALLDKLVFKDSMQLYLGMEYLFDYGSELLVFGSDLINAFIKYKPFSSKDISEIKKDHFGALIICHPNHEYKDETLLNCVEGIEMTHRGSLILYEYEKIKKAANDFKLHLIASSDFHREAIFESKSFDPCFTHSIIENVQINCEKDLILALQNKKTLLKPCFCLEK